MPTTECLDALSLVPQQVRVCRHLMGCRHLEALAQGTGVHAVLHPRARRPQLRRNTAHRVLALLQTSLLHTRVLGMPLYDMQGEVSCARANIPSKSLGTLDCLMCRAYARVILQAHKPSVPTDHSVAPPLYRTSASAGLQHRLTSYFSRTAASVSNAVATMLLPWPPNSRSSARAKLKLPSPTSSTRCVAS